MKRNVFSLLLCLFLIGPLVQLASASSALPMIIDDASLLSDEEQTDLEDKAQSLRATYKMDVVILTVDTLNGKSAQNYADDYYDENGYGYGNDYSGLLFLLAMEEREWYISTCGEAVYAFTDYGLDQLGDLVVSYLSSGDYYNGFTAYLDALSGYFEKYSAGYPLDGYCDSYYNADSYDPRSREEIVYYEPAHQINVILSVVIGVISATVAILIMRGSMNTRRRQYSAESYLKNGSFNLHTHQDMFLYSHVSKVRRQENNGGSHGNRHGGGGSHVHRSSSGRSHGGRGGKF